ncbi:MAG TPA: FHA domain-containing protein, partial [Dermatophilaceae bacterium]|nr:FHA domain-containing protein [Dermatophilaceae bacterium]
AGSPGAGSPGAGAAAGAATAPASGRFGRGRREPRRLAVTAGPLAGTTLPLRPAGTLLGRAPECALVLDDDYASARHARVFHDGNSWVVEDLGSTNGTYLGQERLTAPTRVSTGATLRIGQTVVELLR